MPYIVIGKCVYKKKPDGSKGEKVGCTPGSIKDYLAALHMHADKKEHITKRKNSTTSKALLTNDDYKRKVDRRMRGYGEIDYDKKQIRINPSKVGKGGVLDTVVHEELHRTQPKLTEKQVRKKTKKKLKKMSINSMIDKLKKYTKGGKSKVKKSKKSKKSKKADKKKKKR